MFLNQRDVKADVSKSTGLTHEDGFCPIINEHTGWAIHKVEKKCNSTPDIYESFLNVKCFYNSQV